MERNRNSKGQFLKGNKESPGRKRGGKNKSTEIIEAIGTERMEMALEILDEKLKAKNMDAVKLVLKHFGPRERPVHFSPPTKISNYQEAAAYYVKILQGTAKGILTPSEGSRVAGVVAGLIRALVDSEFQRQLQETNDRIDELAAAGAVRRR